MQRKFTLIGLPGVGKTTLTSRCLQVLHARGLSCDMISTDKMIHDRFKPSDPVIVQFEKCYNINIPTSVFSAAKPKVEFIKLFGEEPLYRDLEEAFVTDIIQQLPDHHWPDLGGKAPLRANTMFALAKQNIVPIFLYAEESTIIARLKNNNNWNKRSNYVLAGADGWQALARSHRTERLTKYLDAAQLVISVESFNADGTHQRLKTVNELTKEIFYRVKEFDNASSERTNCFLDSCRLT